MLEGYAPGYGRDAVSMQAARTAAERAAFAQPLFGPGMQVVDLGCGPGSITVALAPESHVTGVDHHHGMVKAARTTATQAAARQAVAATQAAATQPAAPAQRPPSSTVDFLVASAYSLPFADESVDAAFAHALFEHLASPVEALTELHRILKPGARIALSTSDWSKARLRPKTANVDAALRGHYLLRRRAGGDPFAGRKIADHCAAAGFTAITTRPRYREDMTYRDLARYVESRLEAAIGDPDFTRDRDQLASAARSAWTWVRSGDGDFTQCWIELTATR